MIGCKGEDKRSSCNVERSGTTKTFRTSYMDGGGNRQDKETRSIYSAISGTTSRASWNPFQEVTDVNVEGEMAESTPKPAA